MGSGNGRGTSRKCGRRSKSSTRLPRATPIISARTGKKAWFCVGATRTKRPKSRSYSQGLEAAAGAEAALPDTIS